jgi:hypothetical protein
MIRSFIIGYRERKFLLLKFITVPTSKYDRNPASLVTVPAVPAPAALHLAKKYICSLNYFKIPMFCM